jgi:hypothetical protein
MVQVEFEIDGYKIHVFSRQPESETPTLAVITLWRKTEIRGYIHFYPNDIVLPNPALETEPSKRIRLRFHMKQFPIIVEILRTVDANPSAKRKSCFILNHSLFFGPRLS